MVNVEHLVVAVPQAYKYKSKGKPVVSHDYSLIVPIADALYSHSRISMPYTLTVLGY